NNQWLERFTKSKKEEEEKEIFEIFHKVEVNIPLLDAIKQIPRYAKFLKELCTSKGNLKGNKRVSMGENMSAILQRKLPPKCKDPGVVIQLADRSVVYPEGVLEDVLVQIDVHAGALTMEFDGEIIRFNIFDSMRYPSDIPTALFVDAFDPFVPKSPAIDDKDYIKFALEKGPTPMEEGNMGVDPLVQVNAKFDGDSVFLAKIKKDLTYGPRTYKNKAFHEEISSRKNFLMNIKVFIGPCHLRKHYIEEVDSECPTYSS
ncbi:UNVERIFIED_CONTAM: hypothetical protein Sradi_1281500, partial [Sesamum radiatum]